MLLMGKFVSSLSNGMQLVSPKWIHYGLMAASSYVKGAGTEGSWP
jgi:hypothetical protein